MNLYVILLGLIIILALNYFGYIKMPKIIKNNEEFSNQDCPNILLQKGKHLYLMNNKLGKVPGVNPIKFDNLEEYAEYLKWQRFNNIRCPVLYLQNSYDIQGNLVYVNRKSPFDKLGGTPTISGLDIFNTNNKSLLIDSTRNNPPYNKNLYPGFDPYDQNVGLKTPLDKIYHENPNGVSGNPMDSNWGGVKFTEDRIDNQYYDDNNVKIYIPT